MPLLSKRYINGPASNENILFVTAIPQLVSRNWLLFLSGHWQILGRPSITKTKAIAQLGDGLNP